MDAILQFTVTNQEIERTDEFTVVEGSENYLQAHFTFATPDWDGMIKTGVFINEDGTMYPSLCKDDTCDVPPAWLKEQKGAVGVIGSDGTAKITTYAAKVRIRANGYNEEEIEEETRTYFDQLLEAFANKYLETEAQARLSQRWAVGLEDEPDTKVDNAKYYAVQAHSDALLAESDRAAVVELAEHVAAVGRQVDEDKQAAGQYKEDAAQSALKAALSESNAKASETAAQAAQESAESAEAQAKLYAEQTSSDRTTVGLAKESVSEAKQEVSDKKEYVEQAVGSFELLHQQAVADVNNAGQSQTARMEEAANQSVNEINSAGNTQVNNVNSASQKALENIGNGIDDTLKVKGKAADAAATGKAVEELKGDLSDLAPAGASVGQLFRVAAISEDGKYTIEPVDMLDVQVNGESVVADGVATIPIANGDIMGLVRPSLSFGLNVVNGNVYAARDDSSSFWYRPDEYFVGKYTLANVLKKPSLMPALTAEEQAAARERIGIHKVTQAEYDALTDTSGIYIIVEE